MIRAPRQGSDVHGGQGPAADGTTREDTGLSRSVQGHTLLKRLAGTAVGGDQLEKLAQALRLKR